MCVWIPFRWDVLDTKSCDKVCQLLVAGQWFSLHTLVSSTNKTDRHDITETLKVVLNTITLTLTLTISHYTCWRTIHCFCFRIWNNNWLCTFATVLCCEPCSSYVNVKIQNAIIQDQNALEWQTKFNLIFRWHVGLLSCCFCYKLCSGSWDFIGTERHVLQDLIRNKLQMWIKCINKQINHLHLIPVNICNQVLSGVPLLTVPFTLKYLSDLNCVSCSITARDQDMLLSRNERGRFGALKSDSTHHFFRNACTKSG